MAEYIEREKVYEMLNALGGCDAGPESWADGWDKAIDMAINELNKIPADVRPERHGEWKEVSYDRQVIYCSSCGERSPCNWEWDFCPRCGAKMDGKGGKNNGV